MSRPNRPTISFPGFVCTVAVLSLPVISAAQITDVTSMTATPIPGVGHDYLHDMNEIVSPANGSLSIRIAAPTPHERGLNFPIFAYTYDSAGQITMNMIPTPVGCGGAIYQCTGVNVAGPNLTTPNLWPSFPGAVSSQNISLSFSQGVGHTPDTCSYTGDYIYVDLQGGRHSLGLQTNLNNQQGAGCPYFANGVSERDYGGDLQFHAVNGLTGFLIDNHGDLLGGGLTGGEDTNGNNRNGTGRPWSVTYGTGAQLYSPLSMTVPGYSVPYTYTYAAARGSATSLTSTLVSSASNGTCSGPEAGLVGSPYALQQLNLPNGQYYKFGYEAVYGLVNSITYPTGAKVSYTWGLNSQSEMTGYIENNTIGEAVANSSTCYFIHDWPAIQSRVVYFDGVTKALEQDFSYTTTWSTGGANPYGMPAGAQYWTSKTTTVTTTDWLRAGHPSYQTIYTYIPSISWPQDPTSTAAPSESPLEAKVVYKDTTGSVLRTVTKSWNNELAGECTTLPNGQTSGKFYTYESFTWPSGFGTTPQGTDQITDVQEYDYGSVATPCQNPGTTPARETKTTYASLGNTPYWPSGQYMSDRPSAVQVYDHGTLVSETDYSYDQAAVTAAPQQPIYGHDTVYSASSPAQPRGNATTITKQCFTSAGSCQNSITTLTYDETGQVIAVKDGRGNTTSFDYTDNYTSDDGAPPSGWYTNTYVFAVSPPRTNGRAHGSTYQYDYEKGELRLAIDENGQQSQYSYYGNNYWNRIMEATLADGGQKSYTYSDAGPNPSVSTSTLMNSGESETSTSMMDGVGHVLYVQTSDPFGPDTAQTTYDGNGRAMTISNPFRGCPAPVNPYPGCTPPSNTTTTYYFDALGRSIETSEQDGSTLQSCYDGVVSSPAVYCSTHLGSLTTGTWADSTDENGNHWQRTSDAFGRLTEVMEPSGSSKSASMETDYTYNMLNDLLSVTQWGGPKYSAGARSRSFTYDSMSRLQTAANPETGTICYGQWSGSNCGGGYDQNGNLLYKTDARGFTTSYTYDPLNRVVSKTFPNDTTGTAISCFQYDTSSIPLSGGYLSGRLTNAWTQATKTACTGSSPYFAPVTGSFLTLRSMAYDTIGRLAAAQQQQCIGSQCSAPTSYSLNMLYDLAGNLKQLTNPVGAAGQSLTLLNYFDTASRPCLTTSSWNDNSPSNLFQTNPSTATPGYAPFGGLLNWYMGSSSSGASTSCSSSPASPMNVTQGYTNRLWVNGISATGQIP